MSAPDSTVEWRDVPGFPGYRASSEGHVETQWVNGTRALGSFNNGKPYRGIEWKPVCTRVNHFGYLAFNVPTEASATGKRTVHTVHHFVCLAFHGSPSAGQEVCHSPDPNRLNNRPDNLRWGTHAENLKDMDNHNTRARGTRIPHAKLTEEVVLEMWRLKASGWSNTAIAEKFGTTQPNVCNIFARRAWKWVTPPS